MSGKKSVFLDVDSKLLEKSLLLKQDESNEIADFENFFKTQNLPKDDAPWKLVTPKPGLCAKTGDSKGNKVFINICAIDEIPEPKELSEEQLMELWQSEDATDYRVPLSLQEPHDELDKSGKPSVVYDVAINTKFLKKLEDSLIHRNFVLQVALEGIENKFDIELKKEGYVVLQNRKAIGELRPHRIRLQKGPYVPPKRLIEEVAGDSKSSGAGDAPALSRTANRDNSQIIPKYRLVQKPEGVLVGEFHLPNIVNFKDIALDIGEDRIVLECRRGRYLLDIFIPVNVKEENSTAEFNKDSKILTVTMPVISAAG